MFFKMCYPKNCENYFFFIETPKLNLNNAGHSGSLKTVFECHAETILYYTVKKSAWKNISFTDDCADVLRYYIIS